MNIDQALKEALDLIDSLSSEDFVKDCDRLGYYQDAKDGLCLDTPVSVQFESNIQYEGHIDVVNDSMEKPFSGISAADEKYALAA